MNKAFVREPDQVDPYCPRCGALGEVVPFETLVAQLEQEAVDSLDRAAWFCSTPTCEVAYFNELETVVLASALLERRYPKEPSAPLCACFGLTLDDIDDDVREGVPTRIRELLAKSKSPAAQCLTASPTGRCCLPEVQRVYFRRQVEMKSRE